MCEAEQDRLFYEYAAAELFWEAHINTNFIGLSDGISSVHTFASRLNDLGLQFGCIVDFDFFLQGEFPSFIERAELKSKFSEIRGKIDDQIDHGNLDYESVKKQGLKYLKKQDEEIYEEVKTIIDTLAKMSYFIVPIGQRESFFKKYPENIQDEIDSLFENTYFKKDLENFLQLILS